jgi:exonuclease SbcC
VEGGLSIGKDDLSLVAQDLTAYYPGSAYPVNWGERDKKGCLLVKLEPGDTYGAGGHIHLFQRVGRDSGKVLDVQRIPYPHAPRRKIEATWGDDLTPHLPVKDDLVWLSLRTPKEQCTNDNREIVLQKLLANGALEGSRVTLMPIVSDSVRAPAIAEADGLEAKLRIWAEINGVILTQSILDKAATLEHNAERSGLLPTSFLYHLRSVRMRGAKGIWKGLRVDDIFLDFDSLDPGVIALIGFNGEGKTTLVENCHPYSRMMTRAGVLQDHFRLRDSLREVVFSNDATGEWYRSRMEIDGKNKSGSAKYHLARKIVEAPSSGEGMSAEQIRERDSLLWAPITDGTRAGYDAVILKLLGSFELFTRSAFIPQRPTPTRPALYEATEGEKADLFAELAGLDYLQTYAADAKAQAEVQEEALKGDQQRLDEVERKIADRQGDREQIPVLTDELAQARTKHTELEVEEGAANSTVESLEAKLKLQLVEQAKLRGIDERIGQITRDGQAARSTIDTERKLVNDAPAAEKRLADVKALRASEAKENERILAATKERNQLQGDWTRRITAHQALVAEIEGRASTLRTQKATVEGDRKALRGTIDRLTEDLAVPLEPLDGTCFNCGAELEGEKLEAEKKKHAEKTAKRKSAEKALKDAQEQDRTAVLRLESIDNDQKAIAVEFASAVPPTKPKALEGEIDDSELKSLGKKIAALDPDGAQETVDAAKGSQAKIQAAEKTIAQLGAEYKERKTARDEIAKTIDSKLEASITEAKEQLEAARKATKESAAAVSGIEATITATQKRLDELPELQTARVSAEEQIAKDQAVRDEWRLLERAAPGIQNLELGAMGPSIEDSANKMLLKAYGPRFSIEIRTDRIAGKGKDAHERPTFQIWVLDSECPEIPEADLSNMSGGEAVWIVQNLAEAFTIVREQRHGMKPLTVIKDEGDSALDDDPRTNNRQKYFDMLDAGHAEGGRHQTIVVTHSPEAKDRIPQKIRMADLVVKAELAAAVA